MVNMLDFGSLVNYGYNKMETLGIILIVVGTLFGAMLVGGWLAKRFNK